MLKHLSAAHPPPTYFVIVKIILLQLENTWSVISTFRCNISDQKYKAQVFTWIKKKKRSITFYFFPNKNIKWVGPQSVNILKTSFAFIL